MGFFSFERRKRLKPDQEIFESAHEETLLALAGIAKAKATQGHHFKPTELFDESDDSTTFDNSSIVLDIPNDEGRIIVSYYEGAYRPVENDNPLIAEISVLHISDDSAKYSAAKYKMSETADGNTNIEKVVQMTDMT
ncbi:MAG TPA: hypothetical protein VF575_04355 [Candidatus Saccharimonadales bacterium]|jgi:hypothetical protein